MLKTRNYMIAAETSGNHMVLSIADKLYITLIMGR